MPSNIREAIYAQYGQVTVILTLLEEFFYKDPVKNQFLFLITLKVYLKHCHLYKIKEK